MMTPRLPPFPSPQKNLVVVRAGGKSLHPDWLDLPYPERGFDLIISYFDETAYADHPAQDGVEAVLVKGGKWDGLFKTFQAFDHHKSYDRIWLPDDDIATNAADISAMFETAKTHDLAVCQPSLTLNSYFSHFMFLTCKGFALRYTNYIEIMIPCLKADLFAQVLPLFEDTMSGYGLDYIWCRLPGAGAHKAAVLDGIPMHHTRPIGSQLRSKIADQTGGRSEDEEDRLLARFGGIKKAVPVAYGGITSKGDTITGRFAMARAMYKGYGQTQTDCLDPAYAARKNRQLFKRQLIKPMSLEPLEERARND